MTNDFSSVNLVKEEKAVKIVFNGKGGRLCIKREIRFKTNWSKSSVIVDNRHSNKDLFFCIISIISLKLQLLCCIKCKKNLRNP